MGFTAEIQANIDQFSQALDRAQARMDAFADSIGNKVAKIGSTLQTIGGAISIGITAPLTAAGVAAYNMASDFEDSLGAVDQIFKEASESTKDWANNLPTYFGIAKKEALEYSNMMGSMLKNIGKLTDEEASEQSAKLIELAGDLTAMYGGTTQDAVRALTGALKGNNTMLDNYGMAANDALVKAKALSMGLVEQGKEMTLSAKQAATLALIYEQSGAAQGQAAREAEGASGSWRALTTEITNLTTEIGMHLLPIVTPLITKLKEMVAVFRTMNPETQKMIVTIGAAVAALGPFLVALGSVLKLAPLIGTAFATITGPIGIAVAAIAGAAILIVKNWDKISGYFTSGPGAKLWTSISNAAQELWTRLVTIFNAVKAFVIGVWDSIGSNVKSIVGSTFDIVMTIIDTTIKQITGIINVFTSLIKGDFSGAIKGIGGLFDNIFNGIKSIVLSALNIVTQQLAGFLNLIGADGLGKSLGDWGNSLKPVKEESKAVSQESDKVAESVKKQTSALVDVVPALDGAKKETRNYKNELIDLFAGFGYYDSQIQSITNKFAGFRDIAKKAGASVQELGRIAREEIGEKLIAALGQFDLNEVRSKLSFDFSLNVPEELPGIDKAIAKVQEGMDKAKVQFDEMTIELGSALSNAVSGIASGIGEALASGGNVFDAIGSSLISGLGNLAKSIGEQMIAFGTAGIALKNLMKNPYLAVAAGAALVALGSMASSSVSKQTSGYTGGYSSANQSSSNYGNGAIPKYLQGAYSDNNKVVFEISGDNLVGVLDKKNNKNKRVG